MNRLFASIALCSLFGVSGCMLGPDYERPDQELPDEFRQTTSPTEEESSIEIGEALNDWQKVYRDAYLQELIAAGLEQNLDLAIARSRVYEARTYVAVARSPLFPQLGYDFELEREKDSGLVNSSSHEVDNAFLAGLLSWEIDLWGRNRRSAEAAEALWMATEANRQSARVSLISEISAAYFELIAADQQIAISQRTAESREESVAFSSLRKKQGVISDLEVQQSKVEWATAKSTLPPLQTKRFVLENKLSILLGQPPGQIDQRDTTTRRILPENIPVGLPSTLLKRRPDVLQAEQKLIAANAAIGIAKADFFPRLSLTGSYGQESEDLDDLLNSLGETWTLGLNITGSIFSGGRHRAQLKIARAQQEQAVLMYRQTVLNALQETSNALEVYSRAGEEIQTYHELVNASREYERLARLQYLNGIRSYLDLLDAQRRLFSAEQSLVNSQLDRCLALIQLYKALGGGWDSDATAAFETSSSS